MIANEVGTCSICSGPINIGEEISWNRRGDTGRYHVACKSTANRSQIGANDSLAAILASSLQPYLVSANCRNTTARNGDDDDDLRSQFADFVRLHARFVLFYRRRAICAQVPPALMGLCGIRDAVLSRCMLDDLPDFVPVKLKPLTLKGTQSHGNH